MKKGYLCLVFILNYIFFSCHSRLEISEFVKIHPDKFTEKELVLSDIVESIEYVELDTTFLIRGVWDIEITEEYIFIATRDELLQYERNGKFLRTIGSKGQGPEEFSNCMNIALNTENKKIYVRDGNYIKAYSFYGEYLGKIEIPLEGMVDINYTNGNIYGISMLSFTQEQLPFLWMKINEQTCEVIQKKGNTGIEFETDEMTLRCNYTCRSIDGTILYYNHFNDTIFRLGYEKDKVAYLFEQGDFRLTPQNVKNAEYHMELCNIWDSERFLFLVYRKDRNKQLCIYDKSKRVFYNDEDFALENDLDGILPFKLHSTYFIGEDCYAVQIIPTENMKEVLSGSNVVQYKTWGEKMKFDDNDILVLAKLKK